MRKCTKCLTIRNNKFFHKGNNTDGLHGWCKNCRKIYDAEYSRKYHKEHKLHATLKDIKLRAKRFNIPFNLTEDYLLSIIPKNNMCPIFNHIFIYKDNDWGMTIDRIIPKDGYVIGNIQVISNLANRMKSSATPEQLIMFSKYILDNYKIN
jgi:hypothetical protein